MAARGKGTLSGKPGNPVYPKRKEGIPWKSVGEDEGVLLTLSTGDYFTVNAVGLKIWELADGTRSQDEIALALARSFDVAEKTAYHDTRAFCGVLERAGLVSATTRPAGRPR